MSNALGPDPAMRLPTKRDSRKVTLQRAGDAGGALRQVGTCGYTYQCYSETIASRRKSKLMSDKPISRMLRNLH